VFTIVALTENELTEHDVDRLSHLHDPQPVRVHVLIPLHRQQNRLVEVIDDVALGHLDSALHGSSSEQSPESDEVHFRAALDASVAALTAAGVQADGALVHDDDTVAATADVAARLGADEVIVIAEPHPVEDTFKRDWASQLRDRLELPVLHVVAGTDWVLS
jgi:hypothetical protein